jgi:hypothetical protein
VFASAASSTRMSSSGVEATMSAACSRCPRQRGLPSISAQQPRSYGDPCKEFHDCHPVAGAGPSGHERVHHIISMLF